MGATWTRASEVLHQFFNVSAGYLRDSVTLSFALGEATATKTAAGARNKAEVEAVRVIFARDCRAQAFLLESVVCSARCKAMQRAATAWKGRIASARERRF